MSEQDATIHILIQTLSANGRLLDDIDTYLEQAVSQIKDTLGYYHVQVYLTDSLSPALVLHSGTGEEGRRRKQMRFSLPISARRSLVAQSAREKTPVIVNDTRQTPHHLPNALLPKTRAEAAIPLIWEEQLLGVLDVQHSEPDYFDVAQRLLLEVLAKEVATTLAFAQLKQGQTRLQAHLTAFDALGTAVSNAADENELIEQATQIIIQALQADNAGLGFIESQSGNLRMHRSYQLNVGWGRPALVTGPGEGVTGRVLASGQPWRIPDVSQEPAYIGNPAIHSELCVPIRENGQVIGVINVESVRLNAFCEADEAFLLIVANQLATAFQKIRLAGTFSRQLEEKDTLLAMMRAISSLQLEDVLNAIAQEAKDLLQGDASRIYLLEPDEEALHCVAVWADAAEAVRQFPVKIGQGITGSVALSGVPEIVPNTRYDRRALYIPGTPPRDNAAIFAPLKLRQKVLGVMSIVRNDLNRPFTPTDLTLLTTIAEQAALAIENARLFAAERRKREEFSALNAVAAVSVEAVTEDDLLERATRFIGARLFTDSFGVMLLDEVSGVLRTHHTYWGPEATVPIDGSIAGQVVQTGLPFRTADVAREVRFFEAQVFEMGAQMHAKLCVPLSVSGKVVGVLNAESKQPGVLTDADEKLLLTLAKQMSTALKKIELLEMERKRTMQQRALAEVAGLLLSKLSFRELWTAVSEAAEQTLQVDRTAIFLAGLNEGRLVCAYRNNLSTRFTDELAAHFDQTSENRLLHRREPVLQHNVLQYSQNVQMLDLYRQEGFHSYALFPLHSNGDFLGLIAVYRDTAVPFSNDDVSTGQALAKMTAVAVQNVQLFTERAHTLLKEKQINALIHQLNEEKDMPTILATVIQKTAVLIGAEAGFVSLILEGTIMTYYPYNIPPHLNLNPTTHGKGIAWHIVDTSESILLAHYKQHPQAIPKWINAGIQAFLGVPLLAHNTVQGTLCLLNFSKHKPFTSGDRILAESLARQAGLAIYNARHTEEQNQRMSQLAVSLARQEELDRAKDNFVHTVTHELRTPLGIIMGHTELLESGILGELPATQQESVTIIARRVRMITDMLDDLGVLLAAQTQETHPEVIQPSQFINSILTDFQLKAEEIDLSLIAEIPNALPAVTGDVTHLRRVFDNLLSNAFKFTPAGGRVTVRAAVEGEYVLLFVTDTGVGMPSDQLGRIFERFYQVRGHKNMNPHGSGLGLALVKEIVEAHKGYVHVESEEGKGSTFEVALPITQKM
ncbi:MAG: GAF domain-containing protein [Ardenticatenaceae bacterium]|nr:GAF domain-containing protein [Anaerolineales bacterium]MCB8921482.1 GAF domain-containing protein [Ardenticatenaceae bacterium]MCB8990889.1 GAF domain-containing protein [Ardenticatenaceae bacterium]MCB9004956.1 GAF domain-containing protein [Ardenticatenaceae bacterium]